MVLRSHCPACSRWLTCFCSRWWDKQGNTIVWNRCAGPGDTSKTWTTMSSEDQGWEAQIMWSSSGKTCGTYCIIVDQEPLLIKFIDYGLIYDFFCDVLKGRFQIYFSEDIKSSIPRQNPRPCFIFHFYLWHCQEYVHSLGVPLCRWYPTLFSGLERHSSYCRPCSKLVLNKTELM